MFKNYFKIAYRNIIKTKRENTKKTLGGYNERSRIIHTNFRS
jgi:hypothetical protein